MATVRLWTDDEANADPAVREKDREEAERLAGREKRVRTGNPYGA